MSQPDSTPQSLYDWTQIIYGLHALSLLTGILGAATVIGAFLIGWPSIIAVIMNYIKRSDASGTWLESHFRWQIRTFWFGLFWYALCWLFVLVTLFVGLIVVWIPLGILTIWFIYRVARGVDRAPRSSSHVHVASVAHPASLLPLPRG